LTRPSTHGVALVKVPDSRASTRTNQEIRANLGTLAGGKALRREGKDGKTLDSQS
jgi:hypothetical protein